jgi:hypothetical protein
MAVRLVALEVVVVDLGVVASVGVVEDLGEEVERAVVAIDVPNFVRLVGVCVGRLAFVLLDVIGSLDVR